MIKYHVNHKKFNKKPEPKDIKNITNYILKSDKAVETTIEQLSEYLCAGKTIIASEMDEELIGFKPRKKLMKSQSLILIDIDNNSNNYFSIKDALNNDFVLNNASFIYKTFSYTEENNRFRIVFKTDKPLLNYKQVEALYIKVFKEFPDGVVDEGCKQPSRLFFGGTDCVEIDYNNSLIVDDEILKITLDENEYEDELNKMRKSKEIWINNYNKKNRPLVISDKVEQMSLFEEIYELPTYKLIQLGNCDEEIKRRWSRYSTRLKDKSVFINYVKVINMFDLLGIPETTSTFNCVVYQDSHPSASIFIKEGTDVYLYSRKSKNKDYQFTGNIIQVVQRLTGYNFTQALLKISYWMNIQYGLSEETERIVESLDINISILQSVDLRETFPSIYKIFKHYRQDITYILDILKKNIMEDAEGNMRFISKLSYRSLSEMMYMTEDKYRTVAKIINLLAFTNWIVKLNEDEIPEEIRKDIINYKRTKNYKYHLNIIEVIALQDDFIDNLESITDLMTSSNLTAKNLSWDTVFRLEGKEKADKVFPQRKESSISEQSKDIEKYMIEILLNKIENNSYIEERELLDIVGRKFGRVKADVYFKGIKADLMKRYSLENVRLNKKIKEELGVEDLYTPSQSPRILRRV